MRRAPALALAIALPAAAIVGGNAAASSPSSMPMSALSTTSANSMSGSMSGSMAGMDMTEAATVSGSTTAKHLPGKAKTIKGVVGPDFDISVNPGTVKAGTYKLVVQDKGTIHNFHITGPGGIDKATSVSGTGKTVWKLKLIPGTYTIVCDPHSGSMHTTLTVS